MKPLSDERKETAMKIRLYFDPIDVEVPDEMTGDFYDEGVLCDVDLMIDVVNENWDALVDPSLPTLGAVARVRE